MSVEEDLKEQFEHVSAKLQSLDPGDSIEVQFKLVRMLPADAIPAENRAKVLESLMRLEKLFHLRTEYNATHDFCMSKKTQGTLVREMKKLRALLLID